MSQKEPAGIPVDGLAEAAIRLSQARAMELFKYWCLSWLKGPELDETLSILQTAMERAELAEDGV